MGDTIKARQPGEVRVLVVDDYPEAADTLVALLQVMGYEASAAYGGASAVEAARLSEPAVVISDIDMPEMNGYETAERILALNQTPRPYLIAYTAVYQGVDRRATTRAGFDLHLTKPVSGHLIEEALRRIPH